MQKACLHLTRKETTSVQDDKIYINEVDDTRDLFRVVYRCPDLATKKVFTTTESRVLDYVESIFASMKNDSDPFEYLQVDTAIHPSILYHVSDLDNEEIVERIIEMIHSAMRMDVESQ